MSRQGNETGRNGHGIFERVEWRNSDTPLRRNKPSLLSLQPTMTTKNLLVPVDFSDASFPVIQKAGELAHELPARVVLLHVVEPVAASLSLDSAMDGAGLVLAASWPLETPKSISTLQSRLDTLADPLKAEGIEVHSVAVVGLVVDDILEQSVKLGADYIVLGCHGHLATNHLFTGNVFLGLLKRQPACPMIVVPVEDPSKFLQG